METRAGLLARLFRDGARPLSRHNGEQIHDRLDPAVKPSVVLMNPPFSASPHIEGRFAETGSGCLRGGSCALELLSLGQIRYFASMEAVRESGHPAKSDASEAENPDWAALLASPPAAPACAAQTFLRHWDSASRPVEVECSDQVRYVVKGLRCDANPSGKPIQPDQPKMMFTEQVVGRLAAILGAPVPAVCLVSIPKELIDVNPKMAHMIPCVAHASRSIIGVSERNNSIAHVHENRAHFALLAILFAWVGSGDRQFLYQNAPPYAVYSVDHGHLLPGQSRWDASSLTSAGDPAIPPDIQGACNFGTAELANVVARLKDASPKEISRIVGVRPQDWDIPEADRIALANYLFLRRNRLIAMYAAP